MRERVLEEDQESLCERDKDTRRHADRAKDGAHTRHAALFLLNVVGRLMRLVPRLRRYSNGMNERTA